MEFGCCPENSERHSILAGPDDFVDLTLAGNSTNVAVRVVVSNGW